MGSLFKLRDYWYRAHPGEEFSHTSALTVGNVDNEPSNEEKIVFGSFAGILRVLQPKKKGAARPVDTLVEKDLGAPILQVACRPLEPISGGCPRNLLAVLLPTRLLLIRMHREENTERENEDLVDFLGTTYSFSVYFEAQLEGTAYNFTCGAFGHASYERVCVQSMDGRLTVVDHNSVMFQCTLPRSQFFLPGCLAYCPQRDCFLTNNSALNLLCYSFSTLPTSSCGALEQMNEFEGREPQLKGDAFAPVWTFSLGEDVVGIEVCRHTRELEERDVDIVVLCYHTLFVLQPTGVLRYSKRMDVESLCIASYPLPNVDACNLLVGTVKGSVNVYSDKSLDWSAKMTTTAAPQCLGVGEFLKTKGMIVSLSTDGRVAVNYLGTDPEEDPIQPLESKKMDYEEMERETRRVLQLIKRADDSCGAPVAKENIVTKELLQVEWRTTLMEVAENGDERATNVILTLRNTSQSDPIEEVTLVVHVVEPIHVDQSQRVLKQLLPEDIVQVSFRFSVKDNRDMIMPSSLEARAVAVYAKNKTVTSTMGAMVRLPFALVAQPIPPVTDSQFMMQLNTEKEVPVSLLELFPEMATSSEVSANMLTVRYVNGADAAILASKNACRFRLRASTMGALWLCADELQIRLQAHYNRDVQLSIPDPIPLEDYFAVIDDHLTQRKEVIETTEALFRAAQMFRAVQKRLLLLVREPIPTSSGMMDSLLEESYNILQKCADNASSALSRREQASAMLCCSSRLVLLQLLIKCRDTLTDPDTIHRLESIFTCPVGTHGDVDWEEATDAALGHFLLSTGGRWATNEKGLLNFDTGRLKKHIGALFNRLLDGCHIAFA